MALSTKAIKSKIKSISNIKKITKAMELVAASKMKRAVSRALGTREYAEAALNLLVNISNERHVDHPLLKPGKGNKQLMIIMASEKGLCGSFNVSVSRAASDYFKKNGNDGAVDAVTIGRNAERVARRLNMNVVGTFTDLPDNPGVEDILGVARLILEEFQKGEYANVLMLYTRYVSAISQRPQIREILPVHADIVKDMIEEISVLEDGGEVTERSLALYLFEPNDEEVLDLVLPRLVESNIYQALLESFASEHSARMFAMKNATDNATDLVDQLTLNYNNARQASITQEISEIAAGANALQ